MTLLSTRPAPRAAAALLCAALAVAPPALPQTGPAVCLTFDADMTPAMLARQQSGTVKAWSDPAIVDYLHDEGVPARFFVSGLFAEADPALLARIASDPLFEIGSHGYAHSAYAGPCYGLRVLASDADKVADIERAQAALARAAGRAPARFRFPGLCDTPHDDDLVRRAGLEVDRPTVVSGDAFNPDAAAIAAEVVRRARDGSVILFHVGGPHAPATLDALRLLVPRLRAKGFAFQNAPPVPEPRLPPPPHSLGSIILSAMTNRRNPTAPRQYVWGPTRKTPPENARMVPTANASAARPMRIQHAVFISAPWSTSRARGPRPS
jgi:peptidoglycan-N-acetylglucosamine deacetylase